MGRLDGKVAVISGAARGQGRSHAVTLAREGASIVAFDICEKLTHPLTPGATEEQLAETLSLVEEQDQRCMTQKADARDLAAMNELAERAISEFGHIDILVVNHGLWTVAENSWVLEEDVWQENIDVMLTGAWKVCKAFIPKIIDGGGGGSVVLTSSANGVTPQPGAIAYCAAKAGVIMMMRVLAKELGPHNIRVNTVNPGGIATPMLLEGGTVERALELHPEYIGNNRMSLPAEWLEPEAISNAVLFLASDEGAFVTGTSLAVDAGWNNY
ncbi:MAG TPA: mycofactocin-coupled SDR family oxidoreductase [Solirubrobacteraceae bacterium]|jgi:SDR family mycofactocin-dependent oxidoreductase